MPTVRGAGRAKAAALKAKHEPGVVRKKTPPRAKDKIAAPVAPGTLSARPSKPAMFAADMDAAGWDVKKIRGKESGNKIVQATRGEEMMKLIWSEHDKFIGGRYYSPGHERQVKNASEGRAISKQTAEANAPLTRAAKPGSTRKRELNHKVPFDVEATPDEEVIAKLRGHKVVWLNTKTGNTEEGRVPEEFRDVPIKSQPGKFRTITDATTMIVNSKSEDTLGRRILSFCDGGGMGYRSLFLDALRQVR